MNDELDVNSIERFSKKSDRLILEELGSCEVPAGCGGVVLRWFSLKDGLPVAVRFRIQLGVVTVWCNGSQTTNGFVSVPFGPGVLAIHISEHEHEFDWLSIETRHTSRTLRDKLDQTVVPEMSISNDGTWKFTPVEPGEGWTKADYDDGQWQAMPLTSMPLSVLPKNEQWKFSALEKNNQTVFSIPQSQVWIRKRFDISSYAQG